MGWQELADGVFYRRFQPWDVNVGLVIAPAGVLLIDTRADRAEGMELSEHIKAIDRRPPRWVVNTHRHFDHVGGNACFPDSDVIVGATDIAVDLGDGAAIVRHPGRGHTGEDLVVLVPGVVFAGDLVEESGPLQYDELSYPEEWPATNRRLLDMIGQDDLVVPGHGAVVDRAFVAAQQGFIEANVRRGSGG